MNRNDYLTVKQLRERLAEFADDTLVATSCCASRDCVHVLERADWAQPAVVSTQAAGFSPKGRPVKVLRLWADEDYRSIRYGDGNDA